MEKQVYTPKEAVDYLATRGIHLSVDALRLRRKRGTAKAERVLDRITLWTQEELDAIQPPHRGRRKKIASSDAVEHAAIAPAVAAHSDQEPHSDGDLATTKSIL